METSSTWASRGRTSSRNVEYNWWRGALAHNVEDEVAGTSVAHEVEGTRNRENEENSEFVSLLHCTCLAGTKEIGVVG